MSQTLPVQITGTVVRPPEVRTAIDPDTLRTIPVLHLCIRVPGQSMPINVRQPFCPFNTAGAQAASRRYRVGATVSVECSLADLQLTLHNVQHIRLQQQPPHPRAQAH